MRAFDTLPIYDEALSSQKDKDTVTLIERLFADNVKTRSDLGVSIKMEDEKEWALLASNTGFTTAYLGQYGFDLVTTRDLDGRAVVFKEAKK